MGLVGFASCSSGSTQVLNNGPTRQSSTPADGGSEAAGAAGSETAGSDLESVGGQYTGVPPYDAEFGDQPSEEFTLDGSVELGKLTIRPVSGASFAATEATSQHSRVEMRFTLDPSSDGYDGTLRFELVGESSSYPAAAPVPLFFSPGSQGGDVKVAFYVPGSLSLSGIGVRVTDTDSGTSTEFGI